jgi:hypothetical protein
MNIFDGHLQLCQNFFYLSKNLLGSKINREFKFDVHIRDGTGTGTGREKFRPVPSLAHMFTVFFILTVPNE